MMLENLLVGCKGDTASHFLRRRPLHHLGSRCLDLPIFWTVFAPLRVEHKWSIGQCVSVR